MKNVLITAGFLISLAFSGCSGKTGPVSTDVIALHPENHSYFIYKGKPLVIITSAEHYGSVMNLDFDYIKYLNTLRDCGFNYTRIFCGPYCEMGTNGFGITNNTMNPEPGRLITPWRQDSTSLKYDLDSWNTGFFERLKAFVSAASERNIIVEATLFTSYYIQVSWTTSPFYFRNNINDLDSISLPRANTLYNGKLLQYQEKYVRKIINELNNFGNVTFEIQNEPWSDNPNLAAFMNESDDKIFSQNWQKRVELANDVSLDWQSVIAEIIRDEESRLPNRHLIAQNICNFGHFIDDPNPNISIFNFHYAEPEPILENSGIDAVLSLDETGFMPHSDFIYRRQAWNFILSGGGLYNNLDYSFTVGTEDGTFQIDQPTPGWGGVAYREQLKILKGFIESMDFIKMSPDNNVISGEKPEYTRILSEPGKQYAIYIYGKSPSVLTVEIPDGSYSVEWIDPVKGQIDRQTLKSRSGRLEINLPGFGEDIALKILRK
jgi:hypothetical protein